MNELALFSGAGGGILGGMLLGWRTVCAVEIDAYCREVLMRRQDEGHLPPFPIWDDIRTFDGREWRGLVDVVSAGFPCQPFSVAGKRRGKADSRNLWPETIRVLGEVRPRYALLENVPGLLVSGYFGQILEDLAACGFDARWRCLSAAEVGAPHRRDRLWILAYPAVSGPQRCGAKRGLEEGKGSVQVGGGGPLADAERLRELQPQGSERDKRGWAGDRRCSWWDRDPADGPTQSRVGRVAHGVADWLDESGEDEW